MHTAYIGMGGNLSSRAGRPAATLVAAAERLGRLGRIVSRSSLYSTEPVGFAEQPRFINAVVALETDLEPHELLGKLMAVEQEFGRDRSGAVRNGPRTLDLDILLFDRMEISEPGLEIPHPRLAERAFVLVPLAEIAPDLQPVDWRTVSQLLESLFPGPLDKTHAVLKIQDVAWRAGADRGDAGPEMP